MNLIPLNEVYIGKTNRIKIIEGLFSYIIMIKIYENDNEKINEISKEIDDLYEKIYNKNERILDILKRKNINNKFLNQIEAEYKNGEKSLDEYLNIDKNTENNQQHTNSIFTNKYRDIISPKIGKILKKIILCIEKLLEEEFGIAKVSILFVYNRYLNASINQEYHKDTEENYSRDFVYNTFKDEKIDLINDKISSFDKYIKIDNNAIKFDVENFPILLPLNLPTPKMILKYSITPSDMTSILLHEIGHLFSVFFIYSRFPKREYDNLNTGRKNENFADQFAAIYGYGKHTISVQSKFFELNKYDNINKTSYNPKNGHPNVYRRMRSQMERLKAEQHSPTLTNEKRKELNRDLKDVQKALSYHKRHPFVYNDVNNKIDDVKTYDQYINYLNTTDSSHRHLLYTGMTNDDERKVEKLARFKAKEITKMMDLLYEPGINDNPSIKSLSNNYYNNINIHNLQSKIDFTEKLELNILEKNKKQDKKRAFLISKSEKKLKDKRPIELDNLKNVLLNIKDKKLNDISNQIDIDINNIPSKEILKENLNKLTSFEFLYKYIKGYILQDLKMQIKLIYIIQLMINNSYIGIIERRLKSHKNAIERTKIFQSIYLWRLMYIFEDMIIKIFNNNNIKKLSDLNLSNIDNIIEEVYKKFINYLYEEEFVELNFIKFYVFDKNSDNTHEHYYPFSYNDCEFLVKDYDFDNNIKYSLETDPDKFMKKVGITFD